MNGANRPDQTEPGGHPPGWIFFLPIVISLGLTIGVNAFLGLWSQRGEGTFHLTPDVFNPFKAGGIFFFFCFAFPIGLFPVFSRLNRSKNIHWGILITFLVITLGIISFGFFWFMMRFGG